MVKGHLQLSSFQYTKAMPAYRAYYSPCIRHHCSVVEKVLPALPTRSRSRSAGRSSGETFWPSSAFQVRSSHTPVSFSPAHACSWAGFARRFEQFTLNNGNTKIEQEGKGYSTCAALSSDLWSARHCKYTMDKAQVFRHVHHHIDTVIKLVRRPPYSSLLIRLGCPQGQLFRISTLHAGACPARKENREMPFEAVRYP
eukprot:1134502-Pelagomonas_calceolata.AAC.9